MNDIVMAIIPYVMLGAVGYFLVKEFLKQTQLKKEREEKQNKIKQDIEDKDVYNECVICKNKVKKGSVFCNVCGNKVIKNE